MSQLITIQTDHHLSTTTNPVVPALFTNAGDNAALKYIEFFTANIRNENTRQAYHRAVLQFSGWCEQQDFELAHLSPVIVAAYIEHLGQTVAAPTVKQHLAAIRMLFDYLVVGQAIPFNPASAVRGPKHVVKKGKTPVLNTAETRQLLESINLDTVGGLRDRALIGVMAYSFARVGAVVGMKVEDYYQNGRRCWFRLHEKGGKHHEVPVHHKAEEYMDHYLAEAGIAGEKKTPLFRSLNRKREISERRMHRNDVWGMIKRRARQAGLSETICCHTFRATGITAYLENGGTIENAQAIAAHESPRTTKLYDRTGDKISLDEIERIRF